MEYKNMISPFSTRESMAERVANMVAVKLRDAIKNKGSAVFAVSGGSTPATLYGLLSKIDLNWSKVTVLLVDERWVDPDNSGSNEKFVRNALLQHEAAVAKFVGLQSAAPTPHAGVSVVQKRLSGLPNIDVAVLGMGKDGHTASWFPHSSGLAAALDEREDTSPRVVAITANPSPVTGEYLERMTLTLGTIKSSSFICLLLAGDDKRVTFEKACEAGSISDMPVRSLLRSCDSLFVGWAP